MPPREDASGGGGASAAAPATNPAPPQPADGKGKAKATGDDLEEGDIVLKQHLELCVLMAQNADPVVQKRGISRLRREIRAAGKSITDIFKLLSPHYGKLKSYFETMPESNLKTAMAGILSVLALTVSSQAKRESLKYCMMASPDDISLWGDVYVRNLACEITDEVRKEDGTPTPIESIIREVLEVFKYYMEHNAEPEAFDLLMEVGYLEMLSGERSKAYFSILLRHVGFKNFRRACLYLITCSKYLAPDDLVALKAVYLMYMKFQDHANALRIGLLLDDQMGGGSLVKSVFAATDDLALKQQFAYMIARSGLSMVSAEDMALDYNEKNALQKIMYNNKLTEGYLTLARDVDVMEPKSPQDIYKAHLISPHARSTFDSPRQTMAATFVNAFVNAGFCQDKLMASASDSSENWLLKNENLGKTTAVASLGLIHLWDPDLGLAQLDKFLSNDDNYIVAGALLGTGIASCGVKNDCDTTDLISKYMSTGASIVRIGAILGLGISYAGSRKDKLKALFSHVLSDPETTLEDLVFSAISLALVFVGSCNEEIAQSILSVLRARSKAELAEPVTLLLPAALGLLYLGKQERATAIVEICSTFDDTVKNYCATTLISLAFAGTGNVNMVQKLLSFCSHQGGTHQGPAVLGIALLAMGEDVGGEMAMRSFEHLLQYGDHTIRRAVPLALAILTISNPKVNIMEMLRRLSNDTDIFVAMSAIVSLGLISAGTNNARVARCLRDLSAYQYDDHLFCVRIAQGLLYLGKGLITLDPCYSDRLLLSPVALGGLVVVLHACLNMESTILRDYPYILYILVLAMQPRMLLTVDEDLKPLTVPVRIGQAVDVAGQAGKPSTIRGFRTQNTPVVLAAGERAELETEKYIPLAPILEGFVILRENQEYPDY